ncbi:phage tail sheath subtilisin-like domain-containing protein [Paenibacillus kandeliae]|uniref:phage tail sheath subtilisin-like domain-containing protein n=1 Tax=Paenibacillus kandeliae TaxID=3231269 RepID=UPI0034594D08
MSIERVRAGAYVDLHAKAIARVIASSGRVLIPYQAEWGQPNMPVDMADTQERTLETGLLVPVLELAAENGATLIGYRVTNGSEKKSTLAVADGYTFEAKYPGLRGNDFEVSIRTSLIDEKKKEILVRDSKSIYPNESYLVADKTEAVSKLKQSSMIRFKSTGAAALTDAEYAKLAGGVTGTAVIPAGQWTQIFNAVFGLDFDAMYLPSTEAPVQAACKQWLLDRRTKGRKLAHLIIAGDKLTDDDIEAHNARSRTMNARYVINNSIAGTHTNGTYYDSVQWAAWVAGLVAGTPANKSFSGVKVPMTSAAKDWSQSEVLKGLAEGTLMATRDGYDYIIEQAINTLSTLGDGEREDFGKIRVSMTIDQILNDINSTAKKFRATLDNDKDGRGTFIGAVKEYLAIRANQKAIDATYSFEESDTMTSAFDYSYYKLKAKPLDSIEAFYVDWEVA